uniref:Reverse transcriptase domain-containing protein n=1 Tax=Tanacetum cinerariifolium TaxID=118510 RepID=A0A6L2M294_TANCI|nr:reverse transcriptase domain-containing protein [Tanacetum cinerariifolium]
MRGGNPFTPRICNFESSRKTRMPNNVKTYDGTGDPEDHVKVFQAAAQVKRWAMPTWCHMFNSTLIGASKVWFDELPPESINGYKDLKEAFLAYFMQQKKYVKNPVEIHNIKQKDGETIEDFMERFKIETRRMKGAPECMRISEFMHGVNNPELTKRLNEHFPKTMEEMMIATTAFIRGEAAAASKKKGHGTLKEILAAEASKFQSPPPMVMPVEKRSSNKFCDFHNDKGHSTDECMHLKKKIEELVRAEKLSHLIKEIKQGREQPKTGRKEATTKDKPMKIYMVQSWQRTQPSDMTGVSRSVAEHRLNIREGCPPVRQKKRGQAPERAKPIQAEVQKLVEARIMREVYYHDWLSNPVMVKKHDGSWRMCVDFIDLNKAYAYKGYHQIQFAEADEEKTAFHTGHGVYCYTKMPFGLKNAGATYQRLMDKAFEGKVRRNIEVYIDDLVVKSHTEAEMVRDIEETFRTLSKLKQHLSELPILVAHRPQEELIMYLSATYGAISAVLMIERGTAQTPIYFISRALQGPELNYSPMEKLVLLLVFAAKDSEGRLQKQSIMLGEHNITYRPRTSVKGQILANFLIEMPGDASQTVPAATTQEEPWTLFTDGSSCVVGSAEYEALVAGLRIATQMEVKNVQVNVESKLVANQVLGTYVAKEDNMIKYLEIVQGFISGFTTFSISQVPRSKNKKTDALSKIASTSFAHLTKQVLVEVIGNKSIKGKEVITVIEEEGPTQMTQLVDYLKEGILPGDEKEAKKIRLKARQYELMEGVLYRRSFLTPWLRCVGPLQADYVMREIHEGSCSIHAGPRSVVAKSMRLGYYWPTMHKDARDMIRKCSDCQVHRPVARHPQQSLTPITAPWPFYKWGIDIAGPFPKGPGKVKFLIVAMDYFTKWIEEKAVATITCGQFADNPFKDWCDKLNITQRFASVKHPQSNGLVERANRSLGEGIKARLGEGNKNWVEELPHIRLPTYRTAVVDVVNNDEELRLNLDLLEERRERAAVCEAKAKSNMMKYYNARVCGVAFKPEDFVYRNNDASHAIAGGKLGPK